MAVVLHRFKTGTEGTFGRIFKDGIPICVTVERPWLDNANYISCIPVGVYKCTRFDSPTNGDCFLVQDVPGRDMIEIHSANVMLQIKGCIAPGQKIAQFKGVYRGQHYDLPGVTNSRTTMKMLLMEMPSTFELKIEEAYV